MIPSTDLGASGKFAWADMPQEYYFTVDDDIVYPPDYVTHYVNMMGRYQNRVILTSHGVMPRPHAKSYFKERSVISFRAGQWRDVRVAVGGTGVMMFCTENFRVRLNDFLAANLADLSVACRGVAYCS